MPFWSQAVIEPPWSKDHTVSLQDHAHYDEIASRGGSDKIQRHKPLSFSFAAGNGRAAGTSGVQEEPYAEENKKALSIGEGWQQALNDSSKVVSVRDVKQDSLKYAATL